MTHVPYDLTQQIDYYRARANEYDEFSYRIGRYDHGQELNQIWWLEIDVIRSALRNLGRKQQVLELAAGTGVWTSELLEIADHVLAVDASQEVLDLNRSKHNGKKLDFLQADLFQWEPSQAYDLVFFSFWISHVPPELLDSFLSKVSRALKVGGQVFILDSKRTPDSTARDQHLPDGDSVVMQRRLNDGRTFDIIKVFYECQELENALKKVGIAASAWFTERYFIYAIGTKL